MLEQAVDVAACIGVELLIFAGVGFLVGGASDVLVDLIWIGRTIWRRVTVYRFHERACVASFPQAHGKRIAVFVPAWHEADVIEPMLRNAVAALGTGDWRIYLGTYPNDPATVTAARAVVDPRVHIVVGDRPGPTTKADCLNAIWRAMLAGETADGWHADAIVLHDAEDVIHHDEAAIYDRLIERFDLVQLPVVPLIDPSSRWVAGHYNDEFAESHNRMIVVREAIGAGIPAAGVGCAFSRKILDRLAAGAADGPFDAASLTEDYELGLSIRQLGGRSAFVRLPAVAGGPFVAVHAHFPATVDAAVRQKARWITGIALSGWDRLGWSGNAAERWMRLHDRRALLSAIVVLAAYLGVVLTVAVTVARYVTLTAPSPIPPAVEQLLRVSLGLLVWRLAVRAFLVGRIYGWREAARSIPRSVVANMIAIMATRRAMILYWRIRRDGRVVWDKTTHRFPTTTGA